MGFMGFLNLLNLLNHLNLLNLHKPFYAFINGFNHRIGGDDVALCYQVAYLLRICFKDVSILGYVSGGWNYSVGEHHIYGSSRIGVH